MGKRIELPAKWRNVDTGTLYAEPIPHVWCATYGDDRASFVIEGGGSLGSIDVEPAPEGAAVTVVDDDAYRRRLNDLAETISNSPLFAAPRNE